MRVGRVVHPRVRLGRAQRRAQVDIAQRAVGADRVGQAVERRPRDRRRRPARQMLGVDRMLVRRDRHDIGDAP